MEFLYLFDEKCETNKKKKEKKK
ncbi:TPA_asm: hypothetical protein HUJ06_000213 [Nelumbo nucifera]|uniref:Uncharacterized protein n=1 Tax=Nelumbo nucifera TaxID=4432 RepID=A0A822ZWJ9_NELNU|nr:TPA_asm: hypothetical protein HUJ06_031944 [Nelumbo nucifera]DAD49734.1 TPA_asm: hypothetical protein HUJ06_000213 [Nelumbo nucifera]